MSTMDGRIAAAMAGRTRSFSAELITDRVGITRHQVPDRGSGPKPALSDSGREQQVS